MEVSVQVEGAKVYRGVKAFGGVKLRAEVKVADRVFATAVCEGAETHWTETFKMDLRMKDVLDVTILSKSLLGKESEVGSASVDVETALSSPESWWNLLRDDEQTGLVHLIVTSAALREEYLKRLMEVELQKEEVKRFKRKYLQKIEKVKAQKRACAKRVRELEAPAESMCREPGSATPTVAASVLERKRENLSLGEEQLLQEKLGLQEERQKLAHEQEQLVRAREHIAAELRKLRQECFSPSGDNEEMQQLSQVRRTLLQKQDILEQQFASVQLSQRELQRARTEFAHHKENHDRPLKTPNTVERTARTPQSRRLLMTTSSNRLLTFV